MGTKTNPGAYDCYEKADPNEPIFTLLGRDVCAPFTVLFWAKMRQILAKDPAQVTEAQEVADAMRDWLIQLGKQEQVPDALKAFQMACLNVARDCVEDLRAANPSPLAHAEPRQPVTFLKKEP